MAVLSARDVSKSHGGNLILDDLSFQVEPGEHIGVVGPNGSGKSTLFRLLLGEDEPDTGEVTRRRDASLGHFEQHNVFDDESPVLEEVLGSFHELISIERKLRELETQMAESTDDDRTEKLMQRHGALHERFERDGGYDQRHRAEAVLAGLGVAEALFEQDVRTLSGGEAGRVALAKLLLKRPEILLLDEPTNHLDVAGLRMAGGLPLEIHGRVPRDLS